MNIELKSKSLSNYYSTKPDNYTLSFHHYNVIVDNESNNEYMLLEQDIELIRNLNKGNSVIYFSDIENLIKVMNNTNIFNRLNDIYLRIRNVEEYSNFNKLNININVVIERKDLEMIKPTNDRIVLQIDDINELPIKKLDELREKYNKKEKTTVLMYSYVDSMWKWYNGVERIYSGYTSLPNYQYKYKDEDLMIYTNWSRFSTTSYLTNENMAYREQITDMHKRYRAYFSLESNLKLDNYVTLEELESKAGRTIEEMLNDKYVKVLTKYEYTYGK